MNCTGPRVFFFLKAIEAAIEARRIVYILKLRPALGSVETFVFRKQR